MVMNFELSSIEVWLRSQILDPGPLLSIGATAAATREAASAFATTSATRSIPSKVSRMIFSHVTVGENLKLTILEGLSSKSVFYKTFSCTK